MWILLLMFSILAGSISILIQRVTLYNKNLGSQGTAVLQQLCTLPVLLPYMVYSLWQSPETIAEELALDRIPFLHFVAATILWAIANVATTKSLQLTQASVFNAIFSLRTVWGVLLAAVFFDETTNLAFWFGTFMILSAAIAVAIDPQQLATFFSINTSIDKRATTHQKYRRLSNKNKGIAISFATSVLVASATFNDASALKDNFNIGAYFVVVFAAPALLIYAASQKARDETKMIVRDEAFRWFWLLGSLMALGGIFFMEAFRRADFSSVSSIKQSQALVVVLGAVFLLKEKDRLYLKLAAGFLTFAGALVIVTLAKGDI